MPGYDGLDLIRLGKEEAPKAEFVIISGYRHFEYAQMDDTGNRGECVST